jgi:hypothetical protein
MTLSTLRPPPRSGQRKTRGQNGAASPFLQGSFIPYKHAGSSRRTSARPYHPSADDFEGHLHLLHSMRFARFLTQADRFVSGSPPSTTARWEDQLKPPSTTPVKNLVADILSMPEFAELLNRRVADREPSCRGFSDDIVVTSSEGEGRTYVAVDTGGRVHRCSHG